MLNETRKLFANYLEQVAKENGSDTAKATFTAAPAVEQKAVVAAQESSEILKGINIVPVVSPEGQAVGISIGSPIAGRTNTANNPRRPRNVMNFDGLDVYQCVKTEYDVALPYSMLDAWAQFPDFRQRIDRAIADRQGLDRIMIGWNGTQAAAETDRATYPLLQDVNIGWLEKIRTKAPQQVKSEGVVGSGKVTVGATGDYRSLDALVFAAIQMLAEHNRQRPDLVVLIDRDLIHSKMLANIVDATDTTGELALNRILASGLVAGIEHRDAPYFPAGKLLLTTLSNLSIYYQKGATRRFISDDAEHDLVGDYQSMNEAYVVEDFGLVAMVENIEFV